MGGEKRNLADNLRDLLGSPPHGRGKARKERKVVRSGGITPAWAGKSSGKRWRFYVCWDHPRMGGEKALLYCWRRSVRGSPPHGRGKVWSVCCCRWRMRITPAWAGKRSGAQIWMLPAWDHPRMGGEKPVVQASVSKGAGSPPHGRGKVADIGRPAFPYRITPAWAGKSEVPGWAAETA